MKILKQEEAKKLRKTGFSIKEISTTLGVSKSSVSLWVRSVPLSKKAEQVLYGKYKAGQRKGVETLKYRTLNKLIDAKDFARNTVKDFSGTKSVEQVCCALLYWCEGTKSISDREFKFTNSDPVLIRTFLNLFRSSFLVDEKKFRVCVHLHDYHNETKQLQFWSKTTTIPLSQFIKPHKKVNTGKQRKANYQGCIQISYNDVIISRQVQAIAKMFGEKYGPIV